MQILLEGDPEPNSEEPSFVKEAYEGLILEASAFHKPGGKADALFPHGFYEVPIGELLSRMKVHSMVAYEWLAHVWGPIVSIVNDSKTHSNLQVVFRAEYCFEIPKAVN